MTSGEQIKMLKETLGTAESPLINRLPNSFGNPAEKLRYRTNFFQALIDQKQIRSFFTFSRGIPLEERTEVLSGLRGVDQKGQESLKKLMTVWEIPTGEIESTLEKIKTNE